MVNGSMRGDTSREASASASATPRQIAAIIGLASGKHAQIENGDDASRRPLARSFPPGASIVLVGVRGAGKRSLGFIAATALGRRFITEDHYFQTITGLSRLEFLNTRGSEEFHRYDMEISRRMLQENRFNCVIDCGLGSLTSGIQQVLKELLQTNPVIHVVRDMDRIRALLNLGDRAAALLKSGDAIHRKCSNYEYFNTEETVKPQAGEDVADRASPNYAFKLQDAQADFSRFVRFITNTPESSSNSISPFSLDVSVADRSFTHALEIPFSSYLKNIVQLDQLECGGDVAEVCVDEWQSSNARDLSKLVAEIRRQIKAPIMLSVRYGPPLNVETYLRVLSHGLQLGVEFLSVDLRLEEYLLASIVRAKGYTTIIGTLYHAGIPANEWRDHIWLKNYQKAVVSGCDMARLLKFAHTHEDLTELTLLKETIRAQPGRQIPLIAYSIGNFGRTSQIFNQTLTSVNHPLIPMSVVNEDPTKACMSSSDAMSALFACFRLDSLDFYIVGGNVSASLSPAMHNSAYQLLGLRHKYTTVNITTWDDVEALAQRSSFGGASVVQPWKVRAISKTATLSSHAKVIGAVNTILPLRADENGNVPDLADQARRRNQAGRVAAWYGDNTDFIGIMICLGRSLSPRNVVQAKTCGLVIGAGGMARAAVYALLTMGCRNVFVYNRTVANATQLVDHFNRWACGGEVESPMLKDPVKLLKDHDEDWPAGYALPTMVVSCVTHENLEGRPGSDFRANPQWLLSESGGSLVEMAYMVRDTPLVKQVKQYREETGRPWVIVNGIETLIEQAIAQFELMTGRKAPKKCMKDAIAKVLEESHTYVADGEDFEVL